MTTQQLHRIVTLQQRTWQPRELRRRSGEVKLTWTPCGHPIRPQSTTERFRNESNIEQASNSAAFRIRWRADVDETMREVYEGHDWDIEGIVEVGRRDKLDLLATRS